MTNADCIRRMNDEQLYDFLSEWECGDIDYSITFCDLCKQGGNELNLDCDGCRKHWLQRDAVEYGGLMYWKKNTTFDATTDRKTENNSEIPNNCKDEPQTEYDKYREKIKAHDPHKYGFEDEPQTERIKTPDYCDICNHKGCRNCTANNLDDYLLCRAVTSQKLK